MYQNGNGGFEFDSDTEEGTKFEVVPKGTYTAEVVDAALADCKNGSGQMVKVTWVISGGQHDDFRIIQYLIVQHTNEIAMKLGRQRLKDLCVAVGFTGKLTDLEVLLHKPCLITVKVDENENSDFGPSNKITRIKPLPTPKAEAPPPWNDSVDNI
jgi:hypothetical protein